MLAQLQANMEEVAGEIIVEQEQKDNLIVAQIEAVEKEIQLTVAWDDQTNYLIGNLDCNFEAASPLVRICNSFGHELDCASIWFSHDHNSAILGDNGYAKQFIFRLVTTTPAKINYFLLESQAQAFGTFLQNTLNCQVEFNCPIDERPYIYSLDWHAKMNGMKFSCYLHLHSLSQAAYLEELVIPPKIRRLGIGTLIVNHLKHLVATLNCRYLYLSAKKHAERFWLKQGFTYVFRANLRNERRRIAALRRQPGWDRMCVEGEVMSQPTWFYRNHPQDDLDLYRMLQSWDPTTDRSICLTG